MKRLTKNHSKFGPKVLLRGSELGFVWLEYSFERKTRVDLPAHRFLNSGH